MDGPTTITGLPRKRVCLRSGQNVMPMFRTKLSLWSPKCCYEIVPDWKWRGSLFALILLCLVFFLLYTYRSTVVLFMNLWLNWHNDILKTESEMVDTWFLTQKSRVSGSSPPAQPSHDLLFFLSVSFGFASCRLSTSATDSFPVILQWFTFSETIS